ncbi:Uncharacterised protein [uncultured Blautia sp.]|nr:Uncharacterised protein [uncultured Blautia sp.]
MVDAAAAAGVAGLFGQDLAKERIQRIADQIRGTDDAVRELEIIAGFSRGQHADKGGLLARAAVNVAGDPALGIEIRHFDFQQPRLQKVLVQFQQKVVFVFHSNLPNFHKCSSV